jgi:D-alanyl-D-alanine carboxypeptidase
MQILFFITILLLSACNTQTNTGQLDLPQSPQIERKNELPVTDISTNAADSVSDYTKEYLLGKFNPATHAWFVCIEKAFTDKEKIYMHREAYDAFKKMHTAAAANGIDLKIISATRNFDYQKGIWERKWSREQYKGMTELEKVRDILRYSSMPGTSRHHWGTDVDFNSVELSYFQNGAGKKLYTWLEEHAAEYGFAQTYTSKANGRTGYEEEKWHWSYVTLSKEILNAYNSQISYADLKGFSGSGAAEASDVLRLYVNGIDSEILK